MPDITTLFPLSYETSRQRFIESLEPIQQRWPLASLDRYCLSIDNDLSIDWIIAPAKHKTEKLLIFTTGEHGVEGYVGSAVMHRFFDTILPHLDPDNTHLLIVHTINPWGMKYARRTNADNIDLNRTFLWPPKNPDPAFNEDYSLIETMIVTQYPIQNLLHNKISFIFKLMHFYIKIGKKRLFSAPSLGQYRCPQGIYYGGITMPEETKVLISLYRQAFQTCDHIVHLDMHTGWGPRYQMTLIDSVYESRPSHQVEQEYEYPAVAAANTDEFYFLQGDMIDWVYSLRDNEYPDTRLYSTTFEFGTYGNSNWSTIRGLRAMIFENQLYWHGARNANIERWVKHEFLELFYPEAFEWRRKAIADADQAFTGILSAEGFITN